ncbi:MAG: MFS transporter [Candidatus Latescibacterota bacterium]
MPHDTRTKFELVRWSIFAVFAVTYMLVFFHRMAPGVLAGELMRAFNTSGAALGSLAAVYFFIYAAMQIPTGVLADTLGPRFTVTVGNLTAGAGAILFGTAQSFRMAYAGRFLVGLGVSVIFISILKNNAVWFSERRFALMSGITGMVGNIGSMLSAGPLAETLKVFSWRTVFIGIGAISLALGILGFLIVRNRPEDAGFPSVREMEGRTPGAPAARFRVSDLMNVVRTRDVWPVFWVFFGVTGCLYTISGLWGVPYLRDVFGLPRDVAARYVTVTLFAVAIGGVLSGWLSDRMRRRKPLLLGGALSYLAAMAAFLYLPWGPGFSGYLLFFLLGFTSTGCIVGYACAKEHTNPAFSGTATSLVNTGMFLSTVLMQPLLGWVLDHTWKGALNGVRVYTAAGYHAAFLILFGGAIIAAVAAFLVRETYGECVWEAEQMERAD